jgi:electron-transferring-flavoprotein dehydrogenase
MNDPDVIQTDVVIVGGGPSGLSTAIKLADLLQEKGATKRIILIEKGSEIGAHILSGAVIRPEVFKDLLSANAFEALPLDAKVQGIDTVLKLTKEGAVRLPFHPPYLDNHGNYVASLGQVCRYLAQVAAAKGVEVYSGFSVDEMVYSEGKVVGVKTGDTGVDHHGKRKKNYQKGTTIHAAITVLAEGSRGSLTRQVVERFALEGGNPQIYSLGVKELWSVPEGMIDPGSVYHTFGYPLKDKEEFGGGFIYGMDDNRVALGLVVGLDYPDPSFDIHAAMQVWKRHPEISRFLDKGVLLESGAKTLPEGGWNALPKYYGDHFMIVGDSAGFLSTPRLKGIHLAVRSGMCAAETAAAALIQGDTSEATLADYEKRVNDSCIYHELYPTRNMRAVMQDGMVLGGAKMGIQMLTRGACLLVPPVVADHETTRTLAEFDHIPFDRRFAETLSSDRTGTVDKVTGVYRSGTKHEEEQPSHLILNDPEKFQRSNIEEYGLAEAAFCPADVYEKHVTSEGKSVLRLHPENCLHCKTCDIKSPNGGITWTPPYGGDGPQYTAM